MFQLLAYKAYAWARGNVFILSFVPQFLAAVISAFLDNVTTMLLVIPVSIEIALTLGVHPLTFLIPQAFASNVGGHRHIHRRPPQHPHRLLHGPHLRPVRREPELRLPDLPDRVLLLLPVVAQEGVYEG
jgi:hypothetical protein